MYRTPAISFESYDRLLTICANVAHVYRPIDYSIPSPPIVYLDPVVGHHRGFQIRAHRLLARELVAYVATTARTLPSGDPIIDSYVRDAARATGASGGPDVARLFRVYGLNQPFSHPGGTVPQVPGTRDAYFLASAAISGDLAQLELDLSASSAADALIDPVLAAEAARRIGGVH